MKNYVKEIGKYIITFIIVLFILLSLLVVTSKIPKKIIEKNIEESVQFFKENPGIKQTLRNRSYTWMHFFADGVILNIIYNIDSENPLESSLWAKYLKENDADINNDFIKTVEENAAPNQQYLRYWHGSMIILRPLLVIFNIGQIYMLNQIVMWIIAIILLIILFIKNKRLAVIYVIAMIMISFPMVPICLEYSWTFHIMLICSIIAIFIEKKSNKNLYYLFLISGMITCFFDFLTTELITIFVPLLMILFIRKEENRLINAKETLIFIIKSCVLWASGYILMWGSKWIISSIVLNINAIDYVKDNLLLRINGTGNISIIPKNVIYKNVIFKNWHNLYPINILKKSSDLLKIVIIFILILVFTFDWKQMKNKWFSSILLLIAIVPYARYLILANHSYAHSFFTFRNQIITIMAISMSILECINYKLLFKEIKIKRKKNETNRINNTHAMLK